MSENIQNETNPEQEELEHEENSVLDGVETIKKSLIEGNQLLDELRAFKGSNVGLLFDNELNEEYQRLFNETLATEDSIVMKARIDRMKGLGFAMKIVDYLIVGLEDDLDNLRENLEYQEAGE